ncbi:putative ribonuclease H-like domain-containing protein [Tanacetum coccineum]
MALPNEHQLTFNQLQKLVSRLAILGVVTPPEDLNVKFLRSLPSEWDTHVVKKYTADNNDDKNLAFLTTSSPSSTNTINTVNTGVSTGTTKNCFKLSKMDISAENVEHQEVRQQNIGIKEAHKRLEEEPKKARENNDAPIIEDWVSDDEEEVEPIPKVEKKTAIPTATKKEPVKPEKPIRRSVSCPNAHKHMVPRVVLMKTGLKTVNNARLVNTVRVGDPIKTQWCTLVFNIDNYIDGTWRFQVMDAQSTCSRNIAFFKISKIFEEVILLLVRANGKQHRASCKTKAFSPITKPLFMLHMDLFGPTFVSSLMHKKYCLVVTDDYSRFSWVFFLKTKDETTEILKNFIKEIENLVDKKVKIIRSDNGTEIKNKVMDKFCREKGIKREYSVARTPQQNGVAKRKNRTVIEAARTMLADSKLPTTFWAEVFLDFARTLSNDLQVEVNNGSSRELVMLSRKFNTVTPEDLVGSRFASEDSHMEDHEIELGNIPQSYEAPTTPHTRIHKDRPIEHGYVSSGSSAMSFCLLPLLRKMKRNCHQKTKPRLVVIGHTQEGRHRYDEVFAPVARIEAIRIFLAYASYMGFMVYQMDVKSAFLYGQIEEEHQELDDIIFGSTKKELCDEFEKLMKDKFQMSSMGELTFFLGLQVQQKKNGIFISQDKYVHEILKKFNYSDVKSASTPTYLEKHLVQDGDVTDVDEHLYRSMIGSLMYLTASRLDIMFEVCACARFQVSPKSSYLLVVKRIFRYLKGKPSLGLWYSKDSPLELVAYTDSDYAGATLDRKSTTGGCQFLGNRLISWQCKKQTVVATSTTEAEYVAATSCCGQVLWIQNQLLDYGYNFMNTVIYIDNTSTICIIENPVQHSKTKHIEIMHPFIRDCNAKKLIQMAKIDTQHNVADLLTKGFDAGRFQYLVSSIGMLNP